MSFFEPALSPKEPSGHRLSQAPVLKNALSFRLHEDAFTRSFNCMVGGLVSGAVATFTGHPLDTIKTRLQAGHTRYTGTLQCLKETVKLDGPRALYKGVVPPLLTYSMQSAILFSTWQGVLMLLHGGNRSNTPLGKVFTAGFVSGLATCVVATPVESVRCKLQVQHDASRAYSGSLDLIKKLYRAEGLPGLYRGIAPMLLRQSFGLGVHFFVYEATKGAMVEEDAPEPVWAQSIGGSVAGAVSWTFVMPVDNISTRIKCLPECQLHNRSKRSMLGVASHIWAEGGAKAFYNGLPQAVARAIVLNALVFPVYENVVHGLS